MKFFSYLCTEEIRTVFTPARIVCYFFSNTQKHAKKQESLLLCERIKLIINCQLLFN